MEYDEAEAEAYTHSQGFGAERQGRRAFANETFQKIAQVRVCLGYIANCWRLAFMNRESEQYTHPESERLFVALEIPEDVKAILSSLQSCFPDLKWTPTSNLHLTLRFIGQIQQRHIERIRRSLRLIQCGSFHLSIVGLGLFRRNGGGILWAGVSKERFLLELKQQVDEALRLSAGLRLEANPFSPHLTLSRLKSSVPQALKAQVQERAEERFGDFHVTGFTLFRSLLRPAGALHELVETYPLDTA